MTPGIFGDGKHFSPRLSWFRACATELVDAVAGYLEILHDHGLDCTGVETDDPGRIVYSDELQVVAVPHGRVMNLDGEPWDVRLPPTFVLQPHRELRSLPGTQTARLARPGMVGLSEHRLRGALTVSAKRRFMTATRPPLLPARGRDDGRPVSAIVSRITATAEARHTRGCLRGRHFKFNDWELKGVPLRVELGPRDLEAGHVLVAQRVGELDDRGRPLKATVPFAEFVASVPARLDAYHEQLLARAFAFRSERSASVDDWDAFAAQVRIGFAHALHCGQSGCEDEIKADTAASPRCIPTDEAQEDGPCIRCGEPSAHGTRIVFARAY